jgi:hypothetical protein
VLHSGEAKAIVRHLLKAVELHDQHYNRIQRESTNKICPGFRSLRRKLHEFQQRNQNIDVIILSETWLDEAERVAISEKNRLREIKHENWKTFCEGINILTNPLYISDRMRRLKCRYKTEGEHEYKDELAISARKTFEKLCSGVDDPMQAPTFDHETQDPFVDSKSTIKAFNVPIKNLIIQSVQSSPRRDRIYYLFAI